MAARKAKCVACFCPLQLPNQYSPDAICQLLATHQDTLYHFRRQRFLFLESLQNIRQGKYFEIEINDKDDVSAKQKIDEMCKKLLVNLIIEDYKINKI